MVKSKKDLFAGLLHTAKIFIVLAFVFSLVSCKSAKKNVVQKQVLRGMIYDWANTPIGSVELTLTSSTDSKFSKTVFSDMTGRFDFGYILPGSYTLTGYVADYEDIYENFNFIDSRQILYIRTASNTQLLEKAYEALGENKFDEAESYIKRANELKHSDMKTLFYEALLNFEKGNFDNALRILSLLEKKDASNIAVLIFAADIYQYEKKDSITALKYLKKAALFSDDSEIQKRIKILENEGEK